jgi:hypothetical protein
MGVPDRWSSPLETLTTGRGDCEDYAIVKYVALLNVGIKRQDVKLVLVHDLLRQREPCNYGHQNGRQMDGNTGQSLARIGSKASILSVWYRCLFWTTRVPEHLFPKQEQRDWLPLGCRPRPKHHKVRLDSCRPDAPVLKKQLFAKEDVE